MIYTVCIRIALACLVQAGEHKHKYRFQLHAAISINEQGKGRFDCTICVWDIQRVPKNLFVFLTCQFPNQTLVLEAACPFGCDFFPFPSAVDWFGFSHSGILNLTKFMQ